MAEDPAALEILGLRARYGRGEVLQGVDLEVAAGEVVALLGRNGVGKTTLVHTVAGFLRPTSGAVRLGGREIGGLAAERIARAGLALVPQGRRMFPSLTVGETLAVAAGRRQRDWTIDEVCQRFPVLAARWGQSAGSLSGGEQQMLAIARALVRNPTVIVMDEPSEGLDPDRVAVVSEVIGQLRQRGTAVLLVEQKVAFALGVADRIGVMGRGRITHSAPAAPAREDPSGLYAELGFG